MNQDFNRRSFLKLAGLTAAALGVPGSLYAEKAWEPAWNSLIQHTTPSWFQDAKFGIYFHWGVISVPAFGYEWYSRNMYIEGTACNKFHNLVYGPPSKFGYKDFIPRFYAEKFNPEEWAELFRKSGAKFAGPVAEHCDGFSMWDSQVNKWNAARMGPRRDVVGELSRAIRNEGLTFITTFHHQWLWGWYPTMNKSFDCSNPKYQGLYGPPAPGSPFVYGESPTKTPPPPQTFQDNFVAKTREVIYKYHPSLLYFDSRLNIIDERHLTSLFSYYYNQAERWQEEVSITYKNSDVPSGVGILDIERGSLAELTPYNWLTDDALGWKSWSYIQNPDYKSAGWIVTELVDIVSKNGSLLLDIPPAADGVIPEPVVGRLLAIGKWLGVNGEAIYGTRPWKIYGEGPTRVKGGNFGDEKALNFVAQDIRFTTRWKTLYATALGWPKDSNELTIKSLGTSANLLAKGEIANISLLGSDAKLTWRQNADGLRIALPPESPGDFAYVFRVWLN
ncbi:MAG: alpha-L-fucosidase [Acidobacteriaceae bacterium]